MRGAGHPHPPRSSGGPAYKAQEQETARKGGEGLAMKLLVCIVVGSGGNPECDEEWREVCLLRIVTVFVCACCVAEGMSSVKRGVVVHINCLSVVLCSS